MKTSIDTIRCLRNRGRTTYADGTTVTADKYDAANRLTQMTDSAYGTVIHNYDGLDRLAGETSLQGSVTYTYYANGLRKTMSPASQPIVNYAYDNDDRLTGIIQATETVAFGYDTANRRKTLTLPNGISATYSYDNANELTGILYTNASNATIGDLGYNYDNGGRRTSQSGSFAANLLSPATTAAGTFDAGNRQTSFNGQTLSYDANGNLTGDGTNTYVWDARDQLEQVKQGGAVIASFNYDVAGRRITKTVNGATTGFLYDGPNAVQETQGSTVNPILTGLNVDEHFARNEGAGRSYFLTDALNSTVALADPNANLIEQYRYDPYGNVTTTGVATNPYQYTGRENDGNGMYYFRARYYEPSMARFISEDPIGLRGGTNTYSYVGGNPMNYTDPLGLACPANLKSQGRCFDSSNYNPDTDGHDTVQGDDASDAAFLHNTYRLDASSTDENYGAVFKDNSFARVPGWGEQTSRGYTGHLNFKDIDVSKLKAVCHSHPDNKYYGPYPGDHDDGYVQKGYPNYIVKDGVAGVLEKVDGQYQYRLLKGRLSGRQPELTQAALDRFQHPGDKP